jgi:hypothetical protein
LSGAGAGLRAVVQMPLKQPFDRICQHRFAESLESGAG